MNELWRVLSVRYGKITVVGAIFFCFILVAASWHFIHSFFQQRILYSELERQKLLQTNDKILNYKNKYGNLDEYMQTIEKRYQLANISLPEQMNQGEFVNFLQKVAQENQVKLISIVPSSIQTIEDNGEIISKIETEDEINNIQDSKEKSAKGKNNILKKLSIDIKIESGYIQLINFLKAIELSERLVSIDNLYIISKDDGNNLNCNINMSIFSLER